jgi:hypothetical protein
MMEERYHETKQNRFYLDMSNVNKNITVEANLISPFIYTAYCGDENILPIALRPFQFGLGFPYN